MLRHATMAARRIEVGIVLLVAPDDLIPGTPELLDEPAGVSGFSGFARRAVEEDVG